MQRARITIEIEDNYDVVRFASESTVDQAGELAARDIHEAVQYSLGDVLFAAQSHIVNFPLLMAQIMTGPLDEMTFNKQIKAEGRAMLIACETYVHRWYELEKERA